MTSNGSRVRIPASPFWFFINERPNGYRITLIRRRQVRKEIEMKLIMKEKRKFNYFMLFVMAITAIVIALLVRAYR